MKQALAAPIGQSHGVPQPFADLTPRDGYTVVSGDSLWEIAQSHGVSVDALEADNPQVSNVDVIVPGDVLEIPGTANKAASLAAPSPAADPGSTLQGASPTTSAAQPASTGVAPNLGSGGVPAGARVDSTLSSVAPHPVTLFTQEINAAANAFDMPADLVGAITYQESTDNPSVMNTMNPGTGLADGGLMQVDVATQKDMMAKHPAVFAGLTGAALNIMAGTAYLAEQFKTFGNWPMALRAYNSGPLDKSLQGGGDLTACALGDPAYITKVSAWWKGISTGQALPANYDPSTIH